MSNEKAIKILSAFREEWDTNSTTPNAQALDIAIKALQQQQSKNDWIPIKIEPMDEEEKQEYKERFGKDEDECLRCPMPEDGQDVLITTIWGTVNIDTFYEADTRCFFDNYGFEHIEAWKPLPEPYKESEKI